MNPTNALEELNERQTLLRRPIGKHSKTKVPLNSKKTNLKKTGATELLKHIAINNKSKQQTNFTNLVGGLPG